MYPTEITGCSGTSSSLFLYRARVARCLKSALEKLNAGVLERAQPLSIETSEERLHEIYLITYI